MNILYFNSAEKMIKAADNLAHLGYNTNHAAIKCRCGISEGIYIDNENSRETVGKFIYCESCYDDAPNNERGGND